MRIFLGLLLTVPAFGQNRAPPLEPIRKDELKADLFFLASDRMRGRRTGGPEYALAAEWIAARYARLGLQPVAPDGSFYHRFDLVLSRLAEGNRLIVSTGPDARRVARQGEDFYPLIFSADAEARGRVSFRGFGISAPDLNWDDYAGRSIKGSIVMIFEGDPAPDDPKSRSMVSLLRSTPIAFAKPSMPKRKVPARCSSLMLVPARMTGPLAPSWPQPELTG